MPIKKSVIKRYKNIILPTPNNLNLIDELLAQILKRDIINQIDYKLEKSPKKKTMAAILITLLQFEELASILAFQVKKIELVITI